MYHSAYHPAYPPSYHSGTIQPGQPGQQRRRRRRSRSRSASLARRVENALEWLAAGAILLTVGIGILFAVLASFGNYLPSESGMASLVGTAALVFLLLLVHRHYQQHGPDESDDPPTPK